MPYPLAIVKFRNMKRKKVIRDKTSEDFPDLSKTFSRIKELDTTSPSYFLKKFVFDY
jgi:hypothetical protein